MQLYNIKYMHTHIHIHLQKFKQNTNNYINNLNTVFKYYIKIYIYLDDY